LRTTYSRVLEVENFCALGVSLAVNIVPATTARMTAAMLPIQNDFMFLFLPEKLFRHRRIGIILSYPWPVA